jgi:glycine/D-amino acid oxidase-like deaminating enzyme
MTLLTVLPSQRTNNLKGLAATLTASCGFSNLFLNVGQGALGFTLAIGSARVVADLVNAQAPAIPLDGLTLRKNFI